MKLFMHIIETVIGFIYSLIIVIGVNVVSILIKNFDYNILLIGFCISSVFIKNTLYMNSQIYWMYLYGCKIFKEIKDSQRLKQAVLFNFLGFFLLIWYFDDVSNIYFLVRLYDMVNHLGQYRTLGIFVIGIVGGYFYIMNLYNKNKEIQEGLFLSDKEITSEDEDILGITDEAKYFSMAVLNNGNKESLVFCINGSWGIGKSSFMNICINELKKKDVIVYKFEPLRYQDRTTLLDKYIDGLISVIRENIYMPELTIFLSKYQKMLTNNKGWFNICNVNFSSLSIFESQDKIFKMLKKEFENIEKRIVVVVDDLDRLNTEDIKDVLYVIKKSFYFNNISYIICMDIINLEQKRNSIVDFKVNENNIDSLENNHLDPKLTKEKFKVLGNLRSHAAEKESIISFIEKFIDVKYNIDFKPEPILKWYEKNSRGILDYRDNMLLRQKIYKTVTVTLRGIFDKEDFYKYLPLIGSIRKIKRLINIMILLDFSKVEFEDLDFLGEDLVHLLLLYINYPDVFNMIVQTETNDKRGFFSGSCDINQTDKYQPSSKYLKYRKQLTEGQLFILDKIFKKEKIELYSFGVSKEKVKRDACFNDREVDRKGNLERYLLLITEKQIPNVDTERSSYIKQVQKFISDKKNITELFKGKNLDQKNRLWWTLINIKYTNSQKDLVEDLINVAIETIHEYPVNKSGWNILSQETMTFYIASLLDASSIITSGNIFETKDQSLISNYIFGEKTFINNGILDKIVFPENIILNLNNLLNFRSDIAATNNISFYSIVESLIKTDDPAGRAEGDTRNMEIQELRKISQWIFKYFKAKVIDCKINIFDLFYHLQEKDICSQIEAEKMFFSEQKVALRLFVLFQLVACSNDGRGVVPCGYYDAIGKEDQHGIMRTLNEYFFGVCFNISESDKCKKYFWSFLIDIVSSKYHIHDREFNGKYDIKEIDSIIDTVQLLNFWQKNLAKLKKYELLEDEVFYYISAKNVVKYNVKERIEKMLDDNLT